MASQVRDIMTKQPIKLKNSAPVSEAARQMRAADVGFVVVEEDGKPCGVVTDRDITIRVVAEEKDPKSTALSEVCSRELTTLSPDDDVDRAVQVMREKAIRRILVVDSRNQAVGVVSLGDLAIERDPRSALSQISAAPGNQ